MYHKMGDFSFILWCLLVLLNKVSYRASDGGTKKRSMLVPGRGGTALTLMCYNYWNLGHIAYICYDAGFTGTCSIQVIHILAQKYIQLNKQINNNYIFLDTYFASIVLKIHLCRNFSASVKYMKNWKILTKGVHL